MKASKTLLKKNRNCNRNRKCINLKENININTKILMM